MIPASTAMTVLIPDALIATIECSKWVQDCITQQLWLHCSIDAASYQGRKYAVTILTTDAAAAERHPTERTGETAGIRGREGRWGVRTQKCYREL